MTTARHLKQRACQMLTTQVCARGGAASHLYRTSLAELLTMSPPGRSPPGRGIAWHLVGIGQRWVGPSERF